MQLLIQAEITPDSNLIIQQTSHIIIIIINNKLYCLNLYVCLWTLVLEHHLLFVHLGVQIQCNMIDTHICMEKHVQWASVNTIMCKFGIWHFTILCNNLVVPQLLNYYVCCSLLYVVCLFFFMFILIDFIFYFYFLFFINVIDTNL